MKLMDNLKMLPELLFTVGPASMQDICRDDFSLLNGGGEPVTSHTTTDRDMCPTLLNRIQNPSPLTLNTHALALPKHLSTAEDNVIPSAFAAVKLEDTNGIDLFPTHPATWQQHPMNNHELAHHRLSSVHLHRFDHNSNSKLLLQGSDDPLISHGANSVLSNDDEHPADFAKCLMTPAEHPQIIVQHRQELAHFSHSARIPQPVTATELQRPVKSGCSSLTKQQLKVKANLMSARNQQQQLQQQQQEIHAAVTPVVSQKQRPPKAKKKPPNAIKLRFHHQALPPEYLSHYEATQGQARPSKPTQQKSAATQQRANSKQSQVPSKPSQPRNSHENVRSWLQKIAEIQRSANASKAEDEQDAAPKLNITEKSYHPSQAAVAQRLALDANNNPENQKRLMHSSTTNTPTSSSIVPANPGVGLNTAHTSNRRSVYFSDLPYMGEITLDNSKPRRGRKPKKADICHLIYKNYGTILSKRPDSQDCVHVHDNVDLKLDIVTTGKAVNDDQPLNLCLRDQATDSYSISSADDASETNSSCPTPVTTPSDFVRDSMLANNLKTSLSNLNEVDNEKVKAENAVQPLVLQVPLKALATDDAVLNPLTAYYQKLLESGVLLNNANGAIKTIQKDNQLALKIPLPSGMFLPTKFEKPNAVSPAPSNSNTLNLEYPEQLSTPSSIKSENSTATNASSSTVLGSTVCSGQQQLAPQKRKRSAIFIPPMNTENTSNPATEVSICKFKFTGGSKPTLQEKKMLSVDAGGNYRYFSGTGDKTARGYEYFPRESLQQTAGLLPGVNCTGQKLSIDIPPPSAGLSNELLYIPESPTSTMLLNSSSSTTNGNVVGTTISPKTPPPSPAPALSFDRSKAEDPNYLVENATYHPTTMTTTTTATSSANALNNRFMVSRKKQALHQLRKSTQREKLEKTFKEQGFLIQTQQLESAEGATYCKFRQLKKFTRYLFRNWKDYLPDDLQRNSSAAALAAAAAAAEDFSHREQEIKLAATGATTTTIGVDDLSMNVMACRGEENTLVQE